MSLPSLRNLLARPRRAPAARRIVLSLEPLEGRWLPSTFMVTNTSDSATPGSGSLRRAILDSNAAGPGPNVIDFAIPGTGVHTIAPTSALPAVTVPTFIDGASQPGFVQANAPQVVIDGTNAGNGSNGLTLAANGCAVSGLAVGHFTLAGVLVQSAGDLVVADYLGTDATGTLAAGNLEGVEVNGGANTVIQNDLISANTDYGVRLDSNSTGAVVSADLVGTDISGARALGNFVGLLDQAGGPGDRIAGNVISGNTNIGLAFEGSGALAANNLIGCDAGGAHALPNKIGAYFEDTSADTLQSNVISGNSGDGLAMQFGTTNRSLVLGNLVGVDLSGGHALGNGGAGIDLQTATNCVVAGNTVAANAAGGIVLNGRGVVGDVIGNVVAGNRVGTDASGTVALGNGGPAGVQAFARAAFNSIDSNLIAGNLADGVSVHDSGTNGNVIQRNLIGLTTGGTALPNGLHGVEIANGAQNTTVFANDVLFNGGHGVVLHDVGTSGNTVSANNISFNAGAGVMDVAGAADNTVGGAAAGQGNTLALNGQAGVWADGALATGVFIAGNAIFGNAGLGGIALTHGANANPAAPALAYALYNGQGITVAAGTLHGSASTSYRLEFFDNPSGGGQGQTFLGSLNVTTDANGDVAFADNFAGALTALTATATAGSNTSVFSAAVAVLHL
jgi:titin